MSCPTLFGCDEKIVYNMHIVQWDKMACNIYNIWGIVVHLVLVVK